MPATLEVPVTTIRTVPAVTLAPTPLERVRHYVRETLFVVPEPGERMPELALPRRDAPTITIDDVYGLQRANHGSVGRAVGSHSDSTYATVVGAPRRQREHAATAQQEVLIPLSQQTVLRVLRSLRPDYVQVLSDYGQLSIKTAAARRRCSRQSMSRAVNVACGELLEALYRR